MSVKASAFTPTRPSTVDLSPTFLLDGDPGEQPSARKQAKVAPSQRCIRVIFVSLLGLEPEQPQCVTVESQAASKTCARVMVRPRGSGEFHSPVIRSERSRRAT